MFLFLMAYDVLSSNVHISLKMVCNGLLHQVWGLVGERVVEKLPREGGAQTLQSGLLHFRILNVYFLALQCVSMNAVSDFVSFIFFCVVSPLSRFGFIFKISVNISSIFETQI